jgi:3',5'-cyclic-AMP phosphodiesterase
MDCLAASKDRVRAQWDIFERVLRANVSTKVESVIGNHDVWGWNDIAKFKSESAFGKRYAMERLELDRTYRSFNRAGWHFVFLDSVHRRSGNGYTAKLDDEQFEWFADDLNRTPKNVPVLIVSHIPILSACAYLDGHNESSGDWRVPGAWMHIDARRIKDLFQRHPNVKACISGHIHLVDHVRYLNVPYYCNGAACGGWWAGPFQECRNGFALVDLYDNGWVQNRYMHYDWSPRD